MVVRGRDISIIWSGPQAKLAGLIDIRDCGKCDRYVLMVDFAPKPGDPPCPVQIHKVLKPCYIRCIYISKGNACLNLN